MNVPVQSTSVTARESCCMSSDACCACRCQGGYLCCRMGHRSPPLCHHPSLSSRLFSPFSSPSITPSHLPHPPLPSPLPPPPSSFSLLCTDTLVESAHYALRWPCIAFYIWHKAVNDTEKREHVKRLKKKKEKEVPRYKGVSWTL